MRARGELEKGHLRLPTDSSKIKDRIHHIHQPGQHWRQGERPKYKICYVLIFPQSRMVYASSRETLKNALNGIAMNWQANDPGELEWADLLKEASKGKGII